METPFSWLQYPFGMALSSFENFLTLPQSDSKPSSSAFPHVVMKSAISPKSLGFSLGSMFGCGYWCVTAFRLSQQSEFGRENAHTHIHTYVSISLSIYILNILSSYCYLPFQSNTMVSIYVISFCGSEKPGSHHP